MEYIVPIGMSLTLRIFMDTKYSFEFSSEVINKNITRLTNQLWKLIPMRENEENWEKQLNIVTIEIAGLNRIFLEAPQFLQMLSKLEGISGMEEVEFSDYRRTVFEVINLLQELKQ